MILQLNIGFFGKLGLPSPSEGGSTHCKSCSLCRVLPLELTHHLVQLVPPLVSPYDGHCLVILLGLQVVAASCTLVLTTPLLCWIVQYSCAPTLASMTKIRPAPSGTLCIILTSQLCKHCFMNAANGVVQTALLGSHGHSWTLPSDSFVANVALPQWLPSHYICL